ncbi:hypothetical protein FR5810_02613 [Bordetella pertussis]|nr:Uncharacterised protein [Bordetella pertussis]CFP61942.1 Uncharacterised protein [Bordetella pertussis]CFW06943.1 Uncharacterised protein [Bordetella pertussis]CPP80294.1 Uncharacterised protein [Bordetella pertussis]VDL05854.1 hypothetical protein FR5810_02613 [Bordetella pertussis]
MSTKPRRVGGGSSALTPSKPSAAKTVVWRRAVRSLRRSRFLTSTSDSLGCISNRRRRSRSRSTSRVSQGEPG